MLSSNNVLLPSNGRPVAAPSQDMVIGCYYLTKPPIEIAQLEPMANSTKVPEAHRAEAESRLGALYSDARRFSSYGEVEMALAHDHVDFSTPCHFWVRPAVGPADAGASDRPEWVRTTVGRVLFNSIIPESIGFLNRTFGEKAARGPGFPVFHRCRAGGDNAVPRPPQGLRLPLRDAGRCVCRGRRSRSAAGEGATARGRYAGGYAIPECVRVGLHFQRRALQQDHRYLDPRQQ